MRRDVHLELTDIIVIEGEDLPDGELELLAAETGRLVISLPAGGSLSTVTREELEMFLRDYDAHEAARREKA